MKTARSEFQRQGAEVAFNLQPTRHKNIGKILLIEFLASLILLYVYN